MNILVGPIARAFPFTCSRVCLFRREIHPTLSQVATIFPSSEVNIGRIGIILGQYLLIEKCYCNANDVRKSNVTDSSPDLIVSRLNVKMCYEISPGKIRRLLCWPLCERRAKEGVRIMRGVRRRQRTKIRSRGLRVQGTGSWHGLSFRSKGKGTAAIHYGRLMTPREIYRLTASSN